NPRQNPLPSLPRPRLTKMAAFWASLAGTFNFHRPPWKPLWKLTWKIDRWKWHRHCRSQLAAQESRAAALQALTDSLLLSLLKKEQRPGLVQARKALVEIKRESQAVPLRMALMMKALAVMASSLIK